MPELAIGLPAGGTGADNVTDALDQFGLGFGNIPTFAGTQCGNLLISGNTIASTDVDGPIVLDPNGVGPVVVNSQLQINGGSPGLNKVLTSDANGLATWEESAAGSAADVKSGMETAIADESTRAVVFAVAFTATPDVVISQNSSNEQHAMQIESVTTTGFTIHVFKTHGGGNDSVDVSWVATDAGNAA